MFVPHCEQELPNNRHEATLTPHSLCHCPSWQPALGKAAGAAHDEKTFPEDALCNGDVTQGKMQGLSELPLQLTEGQQLI